MAASATHVKTLAGVRMPRFIYGTAWKKERTTECVVQAVRLGFRGIDTACQPKHYQEELVGDAIKQLASEGIPRDELFVQTKFTSVDGQLPTKIPYDPKADLPTQVRQSFARSQQNLGTQTIDSLVMHSPMRSYQQTLDVWRTFEELHAAGNVRQLGISNIYDPDLFARLWRDAVVKPAVVQNRFYRESGFDRELRAFCRQHGVVYQSFWTLTANPDILQNAAVTDIAKRLRRTPEQVWFRFVMHLGIAPLTGSTSKHHLEQDLQVFEFALSRDEIRRIAALIGEPEAKPVDEPRAE